MVNLLQVYTACLSVIGYCKFLHTNYADYHDKVDNDKAGATKTCSYTTQFTDKPARQNHFFFSQKPLIHLSTLNCKFYPAISSNRPYKGHWTFFTSSDLCKKLDILSREQDGITLLILCPPQLKDTQSWVP